MMAIQELILQIYHRIVVANRCDQQTFCVSSGRRQHDFESRGVREPRFGILRVIRARVNSPAGRTSKDDRHRNAPAVIAFRSVVDDLSERTGDEVDELKLDDRAKADGCRSASRADKTRFRDGSINHSIGSELLEKALSDFERAAEHADVFAEDEDAGIAPHLVAEGAADGLEVSDLTHLFLSEAR